MTTSVVRAFEINSSVVGLKYLSLSSSIHTHNPNTTNERICQADGYDLVIGFIYLCIIFICMKVALCSSRIAFGGFGWIVGFGLFLVSVEG